MAWQALVLPSSAALGAWSVVVTQAGRRGRVAQDRLGAFSGDDAPLALSDVVIGSESSHLAATIGTRRVLLPPPTGLASKEHATIFYQMRSDGPRPDARTTLSFYHGNGVKHDRQPALQISFASPVKVGISAIERSVDFSRLSRGNYLLDVTVISDSITAARRAEFSLRN